MGTKRVSVKVCDACGKEQTTLYRTRITMEGSKGMIGELCSTCKAPLERVLRNVASRRTPRVSVTDMPVMSMEEVYRVTGGRKARRGTPPETPGNGPSAGADGEVG